MRILLICHVPSIVRSHLDLHDAVEYPVPLLAHVRPSPLGMPDMDHSLRTSFLYDVITLPGRLFGLVVVVAVYVWYGLEE